MAVHKGFPLSLALFQLGHACYSVLAEFEELFQPVLLRLGLGEPCFYLNSEARNLELDGHHGFYNKSHMKGGRLNAHFERSLICPKCTLELVVPIGAVLVDDLL